MDVSITETLAQAVYLLSSVTSMSKLSGRDACREVITPNKGKDSKDQGGYYMAKGN